MRTNSSICLIRPGHFERVHDDGPSSTGDEVKVRVRRIGVCGTDIHAFHGRQPFFEYPRILGHELAVEVLDGQDLPAQLSAGMRCAVEPYLNDPSSHASIRGKSNCCSSLKVMGVHVDGGMRPEISVPADKLHPNENMSCDDLALVEMLSIGQHAVNRSAATAEDYAVVFGAGPIGMSVASFLKPLGGRVAMVDLDASRLEFCRESLGIERTVVLSEGMNLEAALRDVGGSGELPDVIFDATGNERSMVGTFEHVAQGGRIVFVGLFQGTLTFDDPNFHRREITLMASRNATPKDFRQVMSAITDGSVDTGPWITHRLALGDVPTDFSNLVADPSLRKAIISVD